jgi:uncharacterized protein YhaN
MRIDRLDLVAYGPFTGKSLHLGAGDFGLHVIYGDNEAGKSTSLRALIAWLFGIPLRTRDSFVHSHQQLRIGGKLRLADGSELEFMRRKGTKGTLLKYGTDEPLDDAVLLPFLPREIDENLFTKLWGIDYTRLVAGSQELLDQSGDLGQALFSAAVGTASLRQILTGLQSGADALFKPRASTRILNQAIADFKQAQKKIKDASLPVAEWQRLQKELAETLSAIGEVELEMDSLSKKTSRLDRLNRVKGALAERRTLLGRIGELGNIRILAEDFDEKRRTAEESLHQASEAEFRAQAKLKRLQEETASLNVRKELLDNEEAILALYRESGAVEKTTKDRPQQDGKRRLLRNEAEILLKGVRPDIDLTAADTLRPLLNNRKWMATLAGRHSLLQQKKSRAQSVWRDIQDELELLNRQLSGPSAMELDLSELKASIAAARKAGDVEQRLAEVEQRAAAEKAACAAELARLGRFSGSADALLQMALPEAATLDTFEKEEDELSESIKNGQRKYQEIEEDKQQAAQELRSLLLTGQVPTLAELKDSRTVRNTGWALIKGRYIEQIDVAAQVAAFTTQTDLPSLYEQKVELADNVADQLRLAADKVVKRANLEARIESATARLAVLAKENDKSISAWNALQQRWHAIWVPLGISAGTPREMKQWLLRVEKLVTHVQSTDAVAENGRKLAAECGHLKAIIARQIETFDSSLDHREMNLEAMLALCEERVAQEEAERERRRLLGCSLDDAGIRLKRTADELKAVDTDQVGWQQEWGQAIAGLGFEADAHPEQVTEAFDQLVAFFDTFDRSEELRKRIYGIDQVEESFQQKVFDFADSLGMKRDDQSATTIVGQLHRDLNSAREARASLLKIETQIKEVKAELADAAITIKTAREQLGALRHQAGVDSDDDLLAAGEGSRRRREIDQRLEMLEQELNRNGDGLSIVELEKEADQSDMDAIDGELRKTLLELTDLQGKRDGLRDQRQTLQNEISAKDGNAAAANASEEAEQHLARMVSTAENYLRLRIAALILEQRIEEYRKKNQAPVLAH